MAEGEGAFIIAIVGRPNVGKSTLFNRLAGKKLALVHDAPGVTRDRREAAGSVADLSFKMIDTAGLEEEADPDAMGTRMMAQTRQAIGEADLALFLVDARAGVTPADQHFADILRRSGRPVVLVANKCEGRAGETGLYDAYSLGLGDPVAISAEHGEGLADLYDALRDAVDAKERAAAAADATGDDVEQAMSDPALTSVDGMAPETDEEARSRPLALAIAGRPNAGKSTLFNKLLGEDRVITGPEPGLTRDSITIAWSYKDRPVRLVDTAGLRRRAKVNDDLEKLSVTDTQRAIQYADVVILMIDATTVGEFGAGVEKQDLTIAREVEAEGRALVVAVNKWDLVDDRARVRAAVEESLSESLSQLRGVPIVFISALEGTYLDRLLDKVLEVEERWSRRISTSPLNRWLAEAVEQHTPPLVNGRYLKLRYMTQIKSRPPSFVIFVSRPDALPDSYIRYLANGLREAFDFNGVPLRLSLRKGNNPYANR